MKKEYFELSLKNGERAFEGMNGRRGRSVDNECPLAAVQFTQACGREPLHPVEVLDRAYRADGFPTPLPLGNPDET
jgi:hypothetical protein